MLDRASTFADPDVVRLLQEKFVPVAIDQFNQRQQDDAEGRFYRKIASQGARNDFDDTTQGFYIASPGGRLYSFNNNRGAERIRELMESALEKHAPESGVTLLDGSRRDPRFDKRPPEGAAVIAVHAKVLDGYRAPRNRWAGIMQEAVARDTLWITAEERAELAGGVFPGSLATRLARFHLVDNTRGEPTFWRARDVKVAHVEIGEQGVVRGTFHMERPGGSSGYRAELAGKIAAGEDGRLNRFDLVATGDYWGQGRYTRGAPEGEFTLGVSFRIADESSALARIAPQGTKGSRRAYFAAGAEE